MDSTLVSSGLTGAGDHDCKLPIVSAQDKSKKGSKIVTTYVFLDQGSTAVFCTEELMHKLGLTGKKAYILLWAKRKLWVAILCQNWRWLA